MQRGLALVLAGAAMSCSSSQTLVVEPDPTPELVVYSLDEAPADLTPAIEAAGDAIQALQGALLERLTTELSGEGGALAAIDICREVAQAITARVAEEQGVEVGRTSHRLRNPANAPRPWLEPFVEEGVGRAFDTMLPRVVDLGDRVGLVRPLPTLGMCTTCHGPADSLSAEVRSAIAEAYPADEAVGFRVGDLRGWIWAESPKRAD